MFESQRKRHPELEGRYNWLGQYRATISTGAVTTIAAGTSTAGHLLSFRWGDTSGAHCYLRYVGAKFILTTAYGAAQETGCDMILARAYTASHTSGTALTIDATLGKLATHLPASKLTSLRVATSAALTAGTHTLDGTPVSSVSHWSSAVGAQILNADGTARHLYDARKDESPIVFAQDEGFILRNTVLMGATGVGRWDFTIEWDEGVPR
jgi:hypothetical protein